MTKKRREKINIYDMDDLYESHFGDDEDDPDDLTEEKRNMIHKELNSKKPKKCLWGDRYI